MVMMIIGVMKAREGRKLAGLRSWGSEVVCIQDSNMANCSLVGNVLDKIGRDAKQRQWGGRLRKEHYPS